MSISDNEIQSKIVQMFYRVRKVKLFCRKLITMTNMKTVKFKGYFTVIRSDELEYLRQQEQLIKDINKKENIIELPVQEADPEPINLEKIRKEIYKEPKDAYIEENPFKVYTHVNGVDFDMSMEEAEKIIEENKNMKYH